MFGYELNLDTSSIIEDRKKSCKDFKEPIIMIVNSFKINY
ncbi:hypothetical protein Calag_0924 [Caldisphaera lagunensis DSM 15908]|uniref:Uncharacterized protein n=1 Tax=Caldisphaera lagunensis (strain DSM 15908 / JCM 11604 / ANMR 0165 / IC-154) TaxID=1056495 RepID=L0AC92_CALLD|nr:hypothetical protein Calag_0924 [Caldisphaera lagunensis DSM 15908]